MTLDEVKSQLTSLSKKIDGHESTLDDFSRKVDDARTQINSLRPRPVRDHLTIANLVVAFAGLIFIAFSILIVVLGYIGYTSVNKINTQSEEIENKISQINMLQKDVDASVRVIRNAQANSIIYEIDRYLSDVKFDEMTTNSDVFHNIIELGKSLEELSTKDLGPSAKLASIETLKLLKGLEHYVNGNFDEVVATLEGDVIVVYDVYRLRFATWHKLLQVPKWTRDEIRAIKLKMKAYAEQYATLVQHKERKYLHARVLLAGAHGLLGDYATAREILQNLLVVYPASGMVMFNLAVVTAVDDELQDNIQTAVNHLTAAWTVGIFTVERYQKNLCLSKTFFELRSSSYFTQTSMHEICEVYQPN